MTDRVCYVAYPTSSDIGQRRTRLHDNSTPLPRGGILFAIPGKRPGNQYRRAVSVAAPANLRSSSGTCWGRSRITSGSARAGDGKRQLALKTGAPSERGLRRRETACLCLHVRELWNSEKAAVEKRGKLAIELHSAQFRMVWWVTMIPQVSVISSIRACSAY